MLVLALQRRDTSSARQHDVNMSPYVQSKSTCANHRLGVMPLRSFRYTRHERLAWRFDALQFKTWHSGLLPTLEAQKLSKCPCRAFALGCAAFRLLSHPQGRYRSWPVVAFGSTASKKCTRHVRAGEGVTRDGTSYQNRLIQLYIMTRVKWPSCRHEFCSRLGSSVGTQPRLCCAICTNPYKRTKWWPLEPEAYAHDNPRANRRVRLSVGPVRLQAGAGSVA